MLREYYRGRPFQCPDCDYEGETRGTVAGHLLSEHGSNLVDTEVQRRGLVEHTLAVLPWR